MELEWEVVGTAAAAGRTDSLLGFPGTDYLGLVAGSTDWEALLGTGYPGSFVDMVKVD